MDEQVSSQSSTMFGLTIDLNSKTHLTEVASWTRFLAIAGFAFIALMIAYGVLFPELFRKFESQIPPHEYSPEFFFPFYKFRIIMLLYMLIFSTIYFFPCYFTLRFSNLLKVALTANDQQKLVSAFQNLKITVRYLGVLTIIFLGLTVLGFIIFTIAMLSF